MAGEQQNDMAWLRMALEADPSLRANFQAQNKALGQSVGEATLQGAHTLGSLGMGVQPTDLFASQRPDTGSLIDQKYKLLQLLTAHSRTMAQAKSKTERGASQAKVMEEVFDLLGKYMTVQGNASSRMAVERLKSSTSLAKARMQAARQAVTGGTASRSVKGAYLSLEDRVRESSGRSGGLMSHNNDILARELLEILTRSDRIISKEAKAQLWAALDETAIAQSGNSLMDLITTTPVADQLFSIWQGLEPELQAADLQIDQLTEGSMLRDVESVIASSGGGPSAQAAMNFIRQVVPTVFQTLGYEAAPEKIASVEASISGLESAAEPQDSTTVGLTKAIEGIDAMLAGDDDHWTQIRQTIQQNPEYRKTAGELGLDPDDNNTFRFIKRMAMKQVRDDRRMNRQRIRDIKMGTAEHAKRASSAALGGALGSEPELGTGDADPTLPEPVDPSPVDSGAARAEAMESLDRDWSRYGMFQRGPNFFLSRWNPDVSDWEDLPDTAEEWSELDSLDPTEQDRLGEEFLKRYEERPTGWTPPDTTSTTIRDAMPGMAGYIAGQRDRQKQLARLRSRRAPAPGATA